MKCIVEKCNLKAVKDSRCRDHHIEYKEIEWSDNTDRSNPGICKWLKNMYPDHYRDSFSQEHIEVYLSLLELYDPRYINKMHRLRELIGFRGFSKSKIIFGIVSYVIAHNNMEITIISHDNTIQKVKVQEKFIVIFSETGGMSEDFVVNIRDEFSINERIRYYYKLMIQDAKEEDTGQWTRRAFKINGMFVLGLGAGMQARGKIKGAYRPTFSFYDDIYSENNTITEESRTKIKNWFYNAAQHSVDDLLGKSFLVGTIVNDDTVLVECERSKMWKTLKYYPMPIIKFKEFIEKHLKTNINTNECILPFEDGLDEFKKISDQTEYFRNLEKDSHWEITWEDRMGLYQLALKYKEAVENMSISGFYQEYFHVTIPSELRRFSSDYFRNIPEWHITNEYGYTWFHCKELYKKPQLISIEIGVDMASGLVEGDNVAIAVGGMIPDGKLFILDVKYGKFSIRDNANTIETRFDRIIIDREYVSRFGFIDETFRLALEYTPKLIKVGQGGGLENAVVEEMRRLFNKNGNYTPIVPRVQHSKKEERIKETLLPKYETMNVYHREGLKLLEYELEFLGKASSDDLADAVEVMVFNMQRPYELDYDLFTKKERKMPVLGYGEMKEGEGWLEGWRAN